jgi:adenylate kinase
MNIILLAPPQAGKGTQAELLKKEHNLNHISTGNLLRESDDLEIKEMMKSGKLVTDDIVVKVFKDYLEKTDSSNILLDGFPRNINQAKLLDEMLFNMSSKIDYVIELDVDKKILLDRVTGRVVCPKCGLIYNENSIAKPKVKGKCDICNVDLFRRSDDNIETFEIRYNEYLKETLPLIDYYKKQNKLYTVKGMDNKYDTNKLINDIIGKK